MDSYGGCDVDCRGLSLDHISKEVIIDGKSCYEGTYKVVQREKLNFIDGSFLIYDHVIFCADKELLEKIVNAYEDMFNRGKD